MFRVVPLFTGCVGGSWRSSPGIASFPAMAVTLLAGGQIWPPPPPPKMRGWQWGPQAVPSFGMRGQMCSLPWIRAMWGGRTLLLR